MLGLGSVNRAINNAALALEIQSTKLVVESAKDLVATAKDADASTITTARELMASFKDA